MDKYFKSLIFDYQKRRQMQEHPVFKRINITLTSEQTGNLIYLMRQIHENVVQKNPKSVVRLNDWINFYFSSGEKRKTVDNNYQSKQYYGRTEEELMEMSEQLMKNVNSKGNSINLQAAANIIYIEIIDKPYMEYMRCCNAIFRLKQINPNMEFELSKALDTTEYGVDILAKLNNKLVGAIKVVDKSNFNDKIYKQKHSVFSMIWGVNVEFLECSVNGNISGKIPSFS